MESYTINLYPIFQMFVILFAVVGFFDAIKTIANLVSRGYKDKLDSNVIQELVQKFPLVSQDFMNKNPKEQNIENNQEIHEINKKLELVEQTLNKIRSTQRGGL